jgi:hypothetical protein
MLSLPALGVGDLFSPLPPACLGIGPSQTRKEAPWKPIYCIALDVHKKGIACCISEAALPPLRLCPMLAREKILTTPGQGRKNAIPCSRLDRIGQKWKKHSSPLGA